MSELAHFPDPVLGELLYGLLARHRRHGGTIPAAVHSDELFGRSTAIAAFDLPSGLGALARRIPDRMRLGVVALLDHTLFPYYAAFQPQVVRDRAFAELVGGTSSSAHNRLGVNAFAIRPHSTLRFCPECLRAQMGEMGEATWLAVHQAPGFQVCTVHRCMIEDSGVTRAVAGRHGYMPPDVLARGLEATPLPKGKAGKRLLELADGISSLWTAPPPAMEIVHRRDDYRAQLDGIGLMRSAQKVDVVRLVQTFRDHWGPALPHLPRGCVVPDEGGWLASLVRTHRKSFHPILHVMLRSLVTLSPAAPGSPLPFGSGPWECRNQLADHFGQPLQMGLSFHREKYGRVATFSCTCGYEFTRSVRSDGTVGNPRMRSPGPLLGQALRRLVAPGAKLRAVAREVGLDPRTVVREALALRLDVPWSTKPSGRPPVIRERVMKGHADRRPHPGRPRRDWAAHDQDLAVRLRAALRDIDAAVPLVRATRAELERRVARAGYFAKRKAKLPIACTLLDQLNEDADSFQRRRVRHLIADLGGETRPWWIARAAGLKSGRLNLVEEEVRRMQALDADGVSI